MLHHTGLSYEEVIIKAKARSLTPDYQGCVVHINAGVTQRGYNHLQPQEFNVSFFLSDWFAEGQTIATVVNGEVR
jgi:hypothetical protein